MAAWTSSAPFGLHDMFAMVMRPNPACRSSAVVRGESRARPVDLAGGHRGGAERRMNWRALLYCVPLLWPASRWPRARCNNALLVKLQIVGTVMLVPVEVNGISGTFILDTGAAQTVVTPDAVSHFGLALDEWTATTMRGVGGIERRRNADPRSVSLAASTLHRRSVARDCNITRGDAAQAGWLGGRRIDGLLGRDFLSLFDLDLDFPGRTLSVIRRARLRRDGSCHGPTPLSVRCGREPGRKRAGGSAGNGRCCDCRRCWTRAPAGALVAARGMARLGLGS